MAGVHVTCHMELTVLCMRPQRPDVWLIVRHERLAGGGVGTSRPIGVVEVKKPLFGILNNPTFLGQALDYLRVLAFPVWRH